MAAATLGPSTSGIQTKPTRHKQDDTNRPPTIEELLIQIENHIYDSIEHQTRLLIASWLSLSGQTDYFQDLDNIFRMLYRETAMMVLSNEWPKIGILLKRGLSRSLIQYSQSMSKYMENSYGLCTALVMAIYDPWGEPGLRQIICPDKSFQNPTLVQHFVQSEPQDLLVMRVESLVKSKLEEAAIRFCRHCLKYLSATGEENENWRWSFTHWLLRLLFRKCRLSEIVMEASFCSCHDGVRLIYRSLNAEGRDSGPLAEMLVNLFLVRDLLYKSSNCCTSELMKLWCDIQITNQASLATVEQATKQLLIAHSISSAHFYLFGDILWSKFGARLLPLYLELCIRGLTSDLNFLEAAKQANNKEAIIELENHIASVYFKLCTLFITINKNEIAMECLMSSFSLHPTKEKLEWIKKLSLQITKDKALQHRRGNKPESVATKKRNIEMCDQAIQVGDDLFPGDCPIDCDIFAISTKVKSEVNDIVTEPKSDEIKQCLNELKTDTIGVQKNHANKRTVGDLLNTKKGTVTTSVSNHVTQLESKPCSIMNHIEHSGTSLNNNHNDASKTTSNTSDHVGNKQVGPELLKRDNCCDKPVLSEKNNTNHCCSTVVNHTVPNDQVELADGLKRKESNSIKELKNAENRCINKILLKNGIVDQIESSAICNHVNGYETFENSVQITRKQQSSSMKELNLQNKDDLTSLSQNGNKTTNLELINKNINVSKKRTFNETENSQSYHTEKFENKSLPNLKSSDLLIYSIEENGVFPQYAAKSFTQVILDADIPGISSTLRSGLVIVLESLRNKLLQPGKWSQIKQICESYLHNLTKMRQSMLKADSNYSVDSEADSISEKSLRRHFTKFNHSEESFIEDPSADKSHVLKKFMNCDKLGQYRTFVNLSDIHWPEVPLERLFYGEPSSTHAAHKKRHRRHRSHGRNIDKLAIKKFHHGSKIDHILIKKKKRKKKKTKRTKSHSKKHHGKSKGDHSKKKRHKVKKKEGNSGFISGDYCSDFSSEELMRLVKEHSHSYSTMPAITSKHPHSSRISVSSSNASEEPVHKRRKLDSSKQRRKTEKRHDKHKHDKKKTNKRKAVVVKKCKSSVKNTLQKSGNMESHIVRISSVKKMESVQFKQSSMAVNLSEVSKVNSNSSPLNSIGQTNPHIQQIIQEKFESCSPEDIMKMQLLLSHQKPCVSTMSNTMSPAILKYICSKMASHFLSTAHTQNTVTESSPVQVLMSQTPNMQNAASHQEKNQGVKQIIIEAKSPQQSLPHSDQLIPIRIINSGSIERNKLTGNLLNKNCPCITTPPQGPTYTVPVTTVQNVQLVGNKIVIPLPPCASNANTLASLPENVIIVNKENQTQRVLPSSSLPCTPTMKPKIYLPATKRSPVQLRCKPISSVYRTVPKIIKQATKTLTVPQMRRIIKNPVLTKGPIMSGATKSKASTVAKNKLEIIAKTLVPSLVQDPSNEKNNAKTEKPVSNSDVNKLEISSKIGNIPNVDVDDLTIKLDSVKSNSSNLNSSENVTENVSTLEVDLGYTSDSKMSEVENNDCKMSKSTENKSPVLLTVHDSLVVEASESSINSEEVPHSEFSEIHVPEKSDTVEENNETVTEENMSKITTPEKSERTSEPDEDEGDLIVASSSIDKNTLSSDSQTDKNAEVNKASSPTSNLEKEVPSKQEDTDSIESESNGIAIKLDKLSRQMKTDRGTPISEVPTRSFTSISDAVRFSLMDMDDATDSAENQAVLQALRETRESPQASLRYEQTTANDSDANESSQAAVVLTTPQPARSTELDISSVVQRFEAAVLNSQTEKFEECQRSLSNAMSWIMDESGIHDSSQSMNVQKVSDVDSSGEGKEEEKLIKKRKRKDRSERDLEASHKFWCEICHKGFFSAYNLRRHCRNVHKMDLPKGSSDLPFQSNQCHQQQPHLVQSNESSSEIPTHNIGYPGIAQPCISPKGPEFALQAARPENKTMEFATKVANVQITPQLQRADFQMQTPPRISVQPAVHTLGVTLSKDFQLQLPTTASSTLTPPKAIVSLSKSATISPQKFQRLPTPSSTSTSPTSKISQAPPQVQQSSMQQQQRPVGQLQSSGLVQQTLPTVSCQQTQQLQSTQCPHYQASNKIAQQRVGQIHTAQLMHHVAHIPAIQHQAQKQTGQSQQIKKCNTSPQQATKIDDQIQQAAQLAQNQQILANQQLQKLMQSRQNAITMSGMASLGTVVPGVSAKTNTQCFQAQLAAARQAAAAAQLPNVQRSQATSYGLQTHDTASHQFFPSTVQPTAEQSNCPHAFSAPNLVEFSAGATTYPTIRLSTETNEGLEDLEQFLLENMPWSNEQAAAHSLVQQSITRSTNSESMSIALPSQACALAQSKNKTSISRPKPRKPVASAVTSCSKNLQGNLGHGVKKKSSSKKTTKSSGTDCSMINSVAHNLNLIQGSKISVENLISKDMNKNVSANETDSSDSVQCISVTQANPPKTIPAAVNFNTFATNVFSHSDKHVVNPIYTSNQPRFIFSCGQNQNSFLDHSNLVNKESLSLDQAKIVSNSSFASTAHFIPTRTIYSRIVDTSVNSEQPQCPQDIFLGQRNNEQSDSAPKNPGSSVGIGTSVCFQRTAESSVSIQKDLFLGKRTGIADDDTGDTNCISKQQIESRVTSEEIYTQECVPTSICVVPDATSNETGTILNCDVLASVDSKSVNDVNNVSLVYNDESACKNVLDHNQNVICNEGYKCSILSTCEVNDAINMGAISEKTDPATKESYKEVLKDPSDCTTNETMPNYNCIGDCSMPNSNCHIKEFSKPNCDSDTKKSSLILQNDENHFPILTNGEHKNTERSVASSLRRSQSNGGNVNISNFGQIDEKPNKNELFKKCDKLRVKCKSGLFSKTKINTLKQELSANLQKIKFLDKYKKALSKDTVVNIPLSEKNNEKLGTYQTKASVNEIPIGRLRLRDTPKTSVKRTCPCCVDVPKKCRNTTSKTSPKGIIVTAKLKSTLKTKNLRKEKANTRSSQRRLRSRNNAN